MSTDEVFAAAESLPPGEKWLLVSKLWASLSPDTWPRPSDEDIAIAEQRMAELDAGIVQPIPGEVVRKWLRERVKNHG